LTGWAVIDQAIGIIRSRSGISAGEAAARIREHSQREHVNLNAAAATVVQEAVRRARARRRPDTD
jgi:AmiR/NasT family two-component response regulator